MNLAEGINRTLKFGKYFVLLILLINLTGVAFAQADLENITDALMDLCTLAQTILGIAIAAMILLSGATYAAGQVMGAETRARATVWATAMITGAVIGALIYFIVPIILSTIMGVPFALNDPCNFRPAG